MSVSSYASSSGSSASVNEYIPPADPPLAGAVALKGRPPTMEDAVAISPNLCSPLLNHSVPIHYYGIFDGHGGTHFPIMCVRFLHGILSQELMNLNMTRQTVDESQLQEIWRVIMCRVFFRTERGAHNTCVCGSLGFLCQCGRGVISFSGTTALVVVLAEKYYVVANCGNSRAVLCRGDRIIPLSFDHKPNRADEQARIEASGGFVFNNGTDVYRVQGILSTSRAIGDFYLKPYVKSEPEVTFTRRVEEDEFLILASDGMWDFIPVDMACRIVQYCLVNPIIDLNVAQPAPFFRSRSESAAALLSRLALARGSKDNVSVVVVDLKRNIMGDEI